MGLVAAFLGAGFLEMASALPCMLIGFTIGYAFRKWLEVGVTKRAFIVGFGSVLLFGSRSGSGSTYAGFVH